MFVCGGGGRWELRVRSSFFAMYCLLMLALYSARKWLSLLLFLFLKILKILKVFDYS